MELHVEDRSGRRAPARILTSREIVRSIGELKIATRRHRRNPTQRLRAIEDARWAMRLYPGRPKRLQEDLVRHLLRRVHSEQMAAGWSEGAEAVAELAGRVGVSLLV